MSSDKSEAEKTARNKTLKKKLARYMDPAAFAPVEDRIKFTCKNVGKSEHDKRKARRAAVLERADAAIRFFLKPDNLASLNRRASILLNERSDNVI